MIAATDLTVRRSGRVVLDGVTVQLSAGKLTAVIGPNGAGKSTLLAALAGLMPNAAVTLAGAPLSAIPRRDLARRRAYLPQNPHIDWPISVARVVALGLTPTLPLFGLPADHAARVEAALRECDLADLADRPATELSGGELARVMLARAIVGAPEILIVDEPTAGLDPRHALDACRRLRERAGQGATVVMAIHDIALALAHADEIIALRDGRLVAHRPVADVDEALLSDLYDVRVSLNGAAVSFLG